MRPWWARYQQRAMYLLLAVAAVVLLQLVVVVVVAEVLLQLVVVNRRPGAPAAEHCSDAASPSPRPSDVVVLVTPHQAVMSKTRDAIRMIGRGLRWPATASSCSTGYGQHDCMSR